MEHQNFTQNSRGEWVPSIPFPFYGLRKKCWACGAKFWTEQRYREHYALHHILDPDPKDRKPSRFRDWDPTEGVMGEK